LTTVDNLISPKVFKLNTAKKLVKKLNSEKDGWTYKINLSNGGVRIAVYDTVDNTFLGYL